VLGDAEAPLSVRHVDRAERIMTVAYLMAIVGVVGVLSW
jgi:hypothetical protein